MVDLSKLKAVVDEKSKLEINMEICLQKGRKY